MPRGGICIQYIDLKLCMLNDKVFRYGPVQICNMFGCLKSVNLEKMRYDFNRQAEIETRYRIG